MPAYLVLKEGQKNQWAYAGAFTAPTPLEAVQQAAVKNPDSDSWCAMETVGSAVYSKVTNRSTQAAVAQVTPPVVA